MLPRPAPSAVPPAVPPAARRHLDARRRGAAALAGTLLLGGLAACTPVIDVPAGSDAGNPTCAKVVLMTPTEVGGQPKVKASSQATAAWGEPGSAITLRCGVDQPAFAVGACQEIVVAVRGVETAFDWITVQDEKGWTFTTFGRDPAVTVQVPTSVEGQATAPLVDLAQAIDEIPVTDACV